LTGQQWDAVFSSFFWEHVPPEDKPRILAECVRVLRVRGAMVFLYDVETQNPLIRRFRDRSPESYSRLFLERDGHVGYETPERNLELFRHAGLTVVEHHGLEKTCLQSPSVYAKFGEFPRKGAVHWSNLARILGGVLFVPYTVVTRLVDSMICPFLPQEWARIDLVVLRK